jgi:Transposase
MDVIFTHCAGLDVHKKTVMACRVRPDPTGQQADGFIELQEFGTMTADLLMLSDWLAAAGITHEAMESTGEYWRPVYNLLEGNFTIFLVNAAHVKQVPGRKTDKADARWLAKLQRYSIGCSTIAGMGKPPVRILARDHRECLGDGLLQGLQRSGRCRSQDRLDLGPTFFDGGEVGRIRRQIEQPDARGGTGGGNPRHFMGAKIIHNEELAWTQLWQQHLAQKGEKHLAIREARHRHGCDHPLETQRTQHGHMAAPIHGLRRLRPLAARRAGVKAGHGLMAASFVEKDEVFRGERLDAFLKGEPLSLDLRPLLLDGAKRFFYEAVPGWSTSD